jgi:hypothetical protein
MQESPVMQCAVVDPMNAMLCAGTELHADNERHLNNAVAITSLVAPLL